MRVLLALVVCVALSYTCVVNAVDGPFKFPSDFLWGSATAAYQVEGAWNISKGLSIWDVFSHTPGKVADNYTGDVADDNYHRYLEDIQLMKNVGFNAYRFSISWPRLFPTGVPPANPDGFAHYNNLINALVEANIIPFVTLYHWDLPNDLPNTWLNETIQEAFAIYASACFEAFGDRVKHWITFNEPLSVTLQGYQNGASAPGRCSDRTICPEGDSTTEEYIATHNILLSHALAVDIYRNKFQPTQKGVIGITLDLTMAVPLNDSSQDDLDAAERHLIFEVGWFADPIFFGDYPEVMKTLVGDRLPVFTDTQKQMLNGSWDFFGLNHYTSVYASNLATPPANPQGWPDDQQVSLTFERDGVPIGPPSDSSWLQVVPQGMRQALNWVSDRYGNPPIFITENGVDVPNEGQLPLQEALNDQFRVNYFTQYLSNASVAVTEDGIDLRGYFAWSLMDNFEWASGYTKRFGLHYVDYTNNLTRYAKESSKWFTNFIASQMDN